jgi:1,4-alpha-glucan branching enzyme
MAVSRSSKAKKQEASELKYEDSHFVDTAQPVWNYSLFTEEIIRNYQQGTLYDAYHYFGSHEIEVLGRVGFDLMLMRSVSDC